MYGIGVFFALRQAMQAFRPDGRFAFDAPLTPEKVLMALHSDWAGIHPRNEFVGVQNLEHLRHQRQ